MSISSLLNRIEYAGNGVTTAFAFPYQFIAAADLVVIEKDDTTLAEVVKTLTTHYTVAGGAGTSGAPAAGTVTMLTAPATGKTLIIYNDPSQVQPIDYTEGNAMPAETIERGLDRLTLFCQRLKARLDRALGLAEGTSGFSLSLPAALYRGALLFVNESVTGISVGPGTAAERASKYLAFDSDGDPIVAGAPISVAPSAFAETLLDDTTAAAVLATLGISQVGAWQDFAMTNNQAVAASVTGALWSSVTERRVSFEYDLRRKTDSATEVREWGVIEYQYNSSTGVWTQANEMHDGDGVSGVEFSISSAGQVRYTTSNIAGANPIHNLKWRTLSKVPA